MTAAENTEMQRLAVAVLNWLDTGNLNEPPVEDIRLLTELAEKAAKHLNDAGSDQRTATTRD